MPPRTISIFSSSSTVGTIDRRFSRMMCGRMFTWPMPTAVSAKTCVSQMCDPWSWLSTTYLTGTLNRVCNSDLSHGMLLQKPSTTMMPSGVTMNIAFCVVPKR